MLRRCDLRDVFDGYALTGVGFDVVHVLRQFGYLDISDEAVIHRYPLSAAFAYALRFKYVKGRVLTKALLAKFKEHLILEERSGATIEKYCRDVSAFTAYVDSVEVTKELAIA